MKWLVEPHVGYVVVVKGERDAPLQATHRARNAKVFERFAQQGEYLVAVALGADEVGVVVQVVEQALLVSRKPEEIVLLFYPLGLQLVVGALAVHQLAVGVEALAAGAVVAAVAVKVDIAGVVDAREHLAHEVHVVGVGCAHEVVVGYRALVPG